MARKKVRERTPFSLSLFAGKDLLLLFLAGGRESTTHRTRGKLKKKPAFKLLLFLKAMGVLDPREGNTRKREKEKVMTLV